MGVIKKLGNPHRVLVCIDGEELIDTKISRNTGEQYNFGHPLWYSAAKKLNEKRVHGPKGAVKIRFDQPSGQYHILFMEPGDLDE